MGFMFNKITLFSISFISICLIVIGFILQTILIPLQDIDLISNNELLEYQKEYAINFPLGTGLLHLGQYLMVLVIILFIIKFIKSKTNNQKSDV